MVNLLHTLCKANNIIQPGKKALHHSLKACMCVYAHIFMCELGMQCAAKSIGCRWTSEIALRSQTLSLNSALTTVGIDDEYKGLLLKQVGVYRVCKLNRSKGSEV